MCQFRPDNCPSSRSQASKQRSVACSSATERSGLDNAVPPPEVVLAPTSASVTLGSDFHDAAGRLWTCTGKAKFENIDPEAMLKNANKGPSSISSPGPVPPTTVAELAEQLRPVRLVGEYEYRLAEPDTALAEKIMAMATPPETPGRMPSTEALAGFDLSTSVSPQHVFYWPNDDRTAYYPGAASAVGHLSQVCTIAMIGPSTALCAAHCFYSQGAWINGGVVAMAARNYGSSSSTASTPYGTYNSDSVTIPGAWISGAGALGSSQSGASPAAHPAMDWDFAVLEFAPTRSPGNQVGAWFGTSTNRASGYLQNIVAYPSDKPYRSQWRVSGYYSSQSGARFVNYMDIYGGESGACVYWHDGGSGYYCTGIVSSYWTSNTTGAT